MSDIGEAVIEGINVANVTGAGVPQDVTSQRVAAPSIPWVSSVQWVQ
jgi:hypothetical protein